MVTRLWLEVVGMDRAVWMLLELAFSIGFRPGQLQWVHDGMSAMKTSGGIGDDRMKKVTKKQERRGRSRLTEEETATRLHRGLYNGRREGDGSTRCIGLGY